MSGLACAQPWCPWIELEELHPCLGECPDWETEGPDWETEGPPWVLPSGAHTRGN